MLSVLKWLDLLCVAIPLLTLVIPVTMMQIHVKNGENDSYAA